MLSSSNSILFLTRLLHSLYSLPSAPADLLANHAFACFLRYSSAHVALAPSILVSACFLAIAKALLFHYCPLEALGDWSSASRNLLSLFATAIFLYQVPLFAHSARSIIKVIAFSFVFLLTLT